MGMLAFMQYRSSAIVSDSCNASPNACAGVCSSASIRWRETYSSPVILGVVLGCTSTAPLSAATTAARHMHRRCLPWLHRRRS